MTAIGQAVIIGSAAVVLVLLAVVAVAYRYRNAKKLKLQKIKDHEKHHHHKSKKPLTADTPLRRHTVTFDTEQELDNGVPSADLTNLPLLR